MADIICFDEYRRSRKLHKIRAIKKTRKQPKHIKPDRQGHHDSLCGVYSIINALNAVYKLSGEDRERLFKYLIKRLEKDQYVTKAIIGGTYKKHIDNMLVAAIDYLHRRHAVKIAVKRLFKRKTRIGVDRYWQTLTSFLESSKRRAVIIGICGRDDHWTCVRAMKNLAMKLIDSSGERYLRKRSCRIGKPYTQKYYHLILNEAWGLSLKD
jgi:hypothetical protein